MITLTSELAAVAGSLTVVLITRLVDRYLPLPPRRKAHRPRRARTRRPRIRRATRHCEEPDAAPG